MVASLFAAQSRSRATCGRFGASLTRIAALAVGSALWRDHRQQVCGLRTYSSFSYLLSSTYPTPKNAHRNVNAFITRSAVSIRISRRYRKYRTTYTLCEYSNFTSQRLFIICVKNMRANAAAKDFDEWFLGFAILSVDLSWLHFAWDQNKNSLMLKLLEVQIEIRLRHFVLLFCSLKKFESRTWWYLVFFSYIIYPESLINLN